MVSEIPEDIIFNITPYPLRVIEPVASKWLIEASKYTWWGRTALHIRDGEERRRHLEGLTTVMGVEMQRIEERKNELLAERAKMKVVMEIYEEYQQTMKEKMMENAVLENEVNEMMRNSAVRQARKHINNLKGRVSMGIGSTSTPIVDSGSVQPSVNSPSMTSIQYEQRPPLDFNEDSSSDDISSSPPKDDDEVIDDEEGHERENEV
ncbi:MAG: hypothetical protein E6J34_18040 [Chloroflexi bacterium]|nr:MAG: hypothetical protein E6J34_18040 [Chloroflexota bacterium]